MLKKKRRNVMILDLIFNRVKEEGKERLINEQKVIERIEVKRTWWVRLTSWKSQCKTKLEWRREKGNT